MSVTLGAFGLNVAVTFLACALWLLVAFATSRVVHRHAVVDVFWGAGFIVVEIVSLFLSYLQSPHGAAGWWHASATALETRLVVAVMVSLWALRLSVYLAMRQRGGVEDSRYEAIMRGAHGRRETLYALRTIYLTQAVLMWFISLPLQWAAYARHFNEVGVTISVVLVVTGVAFEATGDEQLRRFLASSTNNQMTMNRGLWRFTRHPNYFGDCVVWWGLFAAAAASGWGFLTVLSPVAMTVLLTSVSGKALLEGKLRHHREGYEQYVATTSGFFPWPPKKSPHP